MGPFTLIIFKNKTVISALIHKILMKIKELSICFVTCNKLEHSGYCLCPHKASGGVNSRPGVHEHPVWPVSTMKAECLANFCLSPETLT